MKGQRFPPRGQRRPLSRQLFTAILHGGADELAEQGMGSTGGRFQLGVELAADKPRMLRELDHFNQGPIGGLTADDQPCVFQMPAVFIVDLITMPVPFGNVLGAIGRKRQGVGA